MLDQNDSTRALSTLEATRPSGAEQAPGPEAVAEEPRRVSRAPVRVHDRAGLGSALPAGHLQGVDDELGADVVRDRPAHDTAGVGVDDAQQ